MPFTLAYRDALTWVKGRHTMNFGGDIVACSPAISAARSADRMVFSLPAPLPVAASSVDGAHNESR